MRTISVVAIRQSPPFCVTAGLGTPGWVPDRRKCIFQHKTCEALCCLYYKPPAPGKESTAGLQGFFPATGLRHKKLSGVEADSAGVQPCPVHLQVDWAGLDTRAIRFDT